MLAAVPKLVLAKDTYSANLGNIVVFLCSESSKNLPSASVSQLEHLCPAHFNMTAPNFCHRFQVLLYAGLPDLITWIACKVGR